MRRGVAKRVLPKTIQQAVVDDLREAILRLQLAEGSRLNQSEIAATYGVSLIPVREALKQLESEGLVISSPHKGAFVRPLSASELEDLYDIRIALESLAIQVAISHVKTEHLAELDHLVTAMDSESDPGPWLDLNLAFHRALYVPSQRQHLMSIIDVLRRNTERYLRLYAKSMNRLQNAQREHRRILSAYRKRDVAEASQALRDHLHNTLQALLVLLPERPASISDSNNTVVS